jgi:hypothetical protein
LERIGSELGVFKMDDWYSISVTTVKEQGASFITTHYNSSLYEALKKLFPEHDWKDEKFAKLPQSYWKNENNQRKILEKIGRELGVRKLDDWYKISFQQFHKKKSAFVNLYYKGSLIEALQQLYPKHR